MSEPLSWFFSKAFAALDTISGYILFALTAAGIVILLLPPSLIGVDIAPFRMTWGAPILCSTILFGLLWLSKIARFLHSVISERISARRRQLILIPLPSACFWAPGPPNEPGILQIRIALMATNRTHRSIVLAHVELRPLFRPFDYQMAHQIQIGDVFSVPAIAFPTPILSSGTRVVNVIHLHHGRRPRADKHIWFRLRLTDQLKRRYRITAKLMPHHKPKNAA